MHYVYDTTSRLSDEAQRAELEKKLERSRQINMIWGVTVRSLMALYTKAELRRILAHHDIHPHSRNSHAVLALALWKVEYPHASSQDEINQLTDVRDNS